MRTLLASNVRTGSIVLGSIIYRLIGMFTTFEISVRHSYNRGSSSVSWVLLKDEN